MVTANTSNRPRPIADGAGQSPGQAGTKTHDMTPRAAAAVRTVRQIRPIRISTMRMRTTRPRAVLGM